MMATHNTNRNFNSKAWKRFLKARLEALGRDNCTCVECGINEIEHLRKFKRGLEVHHKDKNKRNNGLRNLETLCMSCHSKKHPEKNVYRWFDENQLQLISFIEKEGGETANG